MMAQSFNSFRLLSWKQAAVAFLVFVYIVINAFRIGGDEFVFNLNNYIIFPFAIGTVILAFKLAREIKVKGKNRLLWWGLFIGWVFWLIAQFLFTVPSLIGLEIPYPSWADFFWVVGYIPMYIALWERLRSLPQTSSSAQRFAIGISSLFSVIGTLFFVLIPIIQSNDPSAVIENILNILYPMLDLVLMVLVIRIFFIYQQGRYGQVWIWLSIGFILMTFADLLFSSISTADLYYPDGQANLLSTIGMDVPFNLSYLFWLIGLMVLQSIQKSHQVFEDPHVRVKLVPNTHLLVFTNADDTIMDVSGNYASVFSDNMAKKDTLQEVLGISPEDANAILQESKIKKILKERPVMAATALGQAQVLISGIVIFSPQGKYSGVYLLLRMLHKDHSLDKLLTDHEKSMVSSILSKTGTKQKEDEEIKLLLVNYDRVFLQALYNRIFNEGGSIMADTFLAELQSISRQHAWQITIQPGNLLDVSALSLAETQEALYTLLEAAKRLVIEIIDEASVNTIIQDVRSKFDKFTLENISIFEFTQQEHA